MFKLNNLPYSLKALEPYISARTIEFHYSKHHQNYVNKLNELLINNDLRSLSLEEIIKKTANDEEAVAIFNNAAQVFNHDFFWQSLSAEKQLIAEELHMKIKENFSSLDNFKKEFNQAALAQFASGWIWLVKDDNNNLEIIKTANADNPLNKNLKPLFTIDVWEHAYYLDYQNRRSDFVLAILDNLINWQFVFKNFKQ